MVIPWSLGLHVHKNNDRVFLSVMDPCCFGLWNSSLTPKHTHHLREWVGPRPAHIPVKAPSAHWPWAVLPKATLRFLQLKLWFVLKQEKTNTVRFQRSDSSMEARCHSWFLQLLSVWQPDLLPHAAQGRQPEASPVAAPVCLAFLFSLKICFLDFISSLFSLLSFLFSPGSSLPPWDLAHRTLSEQQNEGKIRKIKERKKESMTLYLFLRQQVGAAGHWHSPSHSQAAQCPIETGWLSALGKWCETNKPHLCSHLSPSCRAADVGWPETNEHAGRWKTWSQVASDDSLKAETRLKQES